LASRGSPVETAEQRALLKAAGCDYAQGYFYSRPVNPAEFEAMVQRSEDALCLGA